MEMKAFGFPKTAAAKEFAGAVVLKWDSLQSALAEAGFDFAAGIVAKAPAAIATRTAG